jgi:hypothetical protein
MIFDLLFGSQFLGLDVIQVMNWRRMFSCRDNIILAIVSSLLNQSAFREIHASNHWLIA